MTSSADLREKITLQSSSVTRAANGEEVVVWADVSTVWADVRQLGGKEFFAAAQTQDAADHRVIIRKMSGVVRTMRVMWRGSPLDIVNVSETGDRREFLELMCVSGVRNGR